MAMTDTTNLPVPQATPPAQLAALERYGRSAGDLFGELLKFSGKVGTWTAGAQGVEIPVGTRLVAIVPEALAGFMRWENGELVEQALEPVTKVDLQALRASLGGTDRTKWPTGDDGRPEDPWREAAYLPMKNPETGAEYTYSTSSLGGCRAVKKLIATYAWQLSAAPDTTAGHLPVVELGARDYKHPDRKRGTIYNPVLTCVDWVPASAVLDKSSKADEPPPVMFEDHRVPKPRGRPRRSAL
jgi:hypothetical protein